MWNNDRKKWYRPDYDDDADYNTNSESYYKYAGKLGNVVNKVIDRINLIFDSFANFKIGDSKTIDSKLTGTLEDKNLTLTSEAKIAKTGYKNAIQVLDDGLYVEDIKPIVTGKAISHMPTSLAHWTTRFQTGQGATVINGYLYTFVGTQKSHEAVQNVLLKDLTKGYSVTGSYIDPTDMPQITHNLGHCNSVDYINNTLSIDWNSMSQTKGYLAVSDGEWNATVTLFEDIDNTTTFFDYNKATNITFKEGNKSIDGWGGFAFGADYKTLLYARKTESDGKTITITTINLGFGTNDLSDKTTDKTDTKHWGTYKEPKNGLYYNGTAEIANEIVVDCSESDSDVQPQDLTYVGNKLYVGVGFYSNHVFEIDLFPTYGQLVKDIYPSKDFKYGGETEAVAFYQGRLLVQGSGVSSAFVYEVVIGGVDRTPINNADITYKGLMTTTQPINGAMATRPATFTDFADVAKNMIKYAGNWYVNSQTIANKPDSLDVGYYIVSVTPLNGNGNGEIMLTLLNNKPNKYYGKVNLSQIVSWTDSNTLQVGNYGLRVTTNGIQKTSDNGVTWLSI